MSVPSYTILCTQCDYRSSSNATNGQYYYKDDEGQFNLERQLGWCNGCQSITAIEDFSDVVKAATKIKSELESIRRKTGTVWANILNVLYKSRREWLDSTIETINSYAKYIELAKGRTGQERCLKCSSYVVVPYKPAKEGGDLDVHGFMYHGERNTDFVHPGCGGTFYEKADDMRFSMVSYSKFYATDGVFIQSCLEKTKY
jgi:hypothetical protein